MEFVPIILKCISAPRIPINKLNYYSTNTATNKNTLLIAPLQKLIGTPIQLLGDQVNSRDQLEDYGGKSNWKIQCVFDLEDFLTAALDRKYRVQYPH